MNSIQSYNLSFNGSMPNNKVLKPKALQSSLAKSKSNELLAKNETVRRRVPEKKNKNKFLKTALLTLGTVVGLAVIGNRSSNYMAKLGLKVDDYLLKQNWYRKF